MQPGSSDHNGDDIFRTEALEYRRRGRLTGQLLSLTPRRVGLVFAINLLLVLAACTLLVFVRVPRYVEVAVVNLAESQSGRVPELDAVLMLPGLPTPSLRVGDRLRVSGPTPALFVVSQIEAVANAPGRSGSIIEARGRFAAASYPTPLAARQVLGTARVRVGHEQLGRTILRSLSPRERAE